MPSGKVKIEFDTDNDAFDLDTNDEIGRCLDRVKRRIEVGDTEGKVLDSNGNSVGTWSVTL